MDEELTRLVAKAVAGDEEAFRALVDRHVGLVWSVIRSYRLSRGDAEDAAQGVWLSVVEHLGQLREAAAFPAWIATTTRRECLAVLQRSARLPDDRYAALERIAATNTDPNRHLLADERSRALAEAIAELDERCRQLLALLGSDPPLAYEEVSAVLDLPIGAIGPTRNRCLDKIRRHRAIRRLNFT